MTKTDKQALRQTAEKAQEHGVFNMDIHSGTVLALLDELEAADALNKHLELAIRKAEGCSEKLRAGVEAAEKRIAELEARTLTVKLPDRRSVVFWPGDASEFDSLGYEIAVKNAIRTAGIALDTGE